MLTLAKYENIYIFRIAICYIRHLEYMLAGGTPEENPTFNDFQVSDARRRQLRY